MVIRGGRRTRKSTALAGLLGSSRRSHRRASNPVLNKTVRNGAQRDHAVAAAWGFAEATFFFVVPDVWTSWTALRKPKRAMATTVSALGGALVGGTLTYMWGRRKPPQATRSELSKIPAITDRMVTDVEREVEEKGNASVMRGPTRGVPYKIYARTAGVQGKSLLSFLAWSVPGRLLRFLAVTLFAAGLSAGARRLFPPIPEKLITGVFWGCWVAFYSWYVPTVTRRRS